MNAMLLPGSANTARRSVLSTLREAWRMRRVWWFTATARTRARFVRTYFGSFWLGLSNLFSVAVLSAVYGTVFKVQDFQTYVVYLGLGLVVWNTMAAAISSAPTLFEHNHSHVHNTSLNPVFYTLEEWSFQLQTFLMSFLLVVCVLSFFKPNTPLKRQKISINTVMTLGGSDLGYASPQTIKIVKVTQTQVIRTHIIQVCRIHRHVPWSPSDRRNTENFRGWIPRVRI